MMTILPSISPHAIRRQGIDNTSTPECSAVLPLRSLLRFLLALLLLITGGSGAWGQTTFSGPGTYFITFREYNSTDLTQNFYLCPTENWIYYVATNNWTATDNGQPFLTTYKGKDDDNYDIKKAKWTIEKYDDTYYYIKHTIDGKYLTFNGQISGTSNVNRIRVHLENNATPNDNMLFSISPVTGKTYYLISPKNAPGYYINVNKGNVNSLQGAKTGPGGDSTEGPTGYKNTAGLICIWNQSSDTNVPAYFEEVVPTPTVTLNEGNVEIACSQDGTTIYYTTDGSDPEIGGATTSVYSDPFPFGGGITSVKAIAYNAAYDESSKVGELSIMTTIHVVNKSNEIAITYHDGITDLTAVPDEIRSPYIPNAANYKLFTTQAAAYAYTSATTAEARATAAAAAITSINSSDQTFYAGYHYDEAERPIDLPLLDGSKWYQMKHNYNGVDNYIYANLNNNQNPESSNIASTTSDASITSNLYLWHFIGNDPYDIRMANRFMNEHRTSAERLVKENASVTGSWYRSVAGYHENDGVSMVMLRYDANHYNLAIVSNTAQLGNYQYLYYFGASAQNNANVYFMRNNAAASPLYVSDRAGSQLSFTALDAEYTYNIVDTHGNVAIQYTVSQSVGMALNYEAIPEAIRSPYISGEALSFYTFSGAYSSAQLTHENMIDKTPVDDANIYVKYTTDHLLDAGRFLHLRGARVFNIKVNGNYIYDDNGTLAHEDIDANLENNNRVWAFVGNDPYAVQVKNIDTQRSLGYTTPSTLSVADDPTNKHFILMAGSDDGDGSTYGQFELMAATGDDHLYRIGRPSELDISTTTAGDATVQIQAYVKTFTINYHLIDKAGKLIEGPIPASSAELMLPAEWQSPLVSAYHYWNTPGLVGDTYSPTTPVSTLGEVSGTNVYVTYDVGNAIDLTGNKTYLLRFSDGESFKQENGSDGLIDTPTQAVYPYNNGDFNLYVYGQEQWEAQLSSGASTRTRWLWYVVSRHNGIDLTGDDVDPYHVVIKSYQNHTVKDKKEGEDFNYGPGCSYLQTYKPSDYASVVTNIAYENAAYNSAYPGKMPTSVVNGEPTEYMILGTSMLNMTLKTFNKVEGERRIVNTFEQYWKNNPTVHNLVGDNPAADNATLTTMGWHQFTSWAYSAPWDSSTKALAEGKHWYQTITMGTGQFTMEEVSLAPQVILLDKHGWEIMRIPLADAATLRKYDSPMVQTYHWYPTALKASGYHKYTVSSQEITVYDSNRKPTDYRFTHNSSSLAYTPYDYFETIREANGWVAQDDRVKTDFYVTYDVKAAYANSYRGAAKEGLTVASTFLLKQGGVFASTNGEAITTAADPSNLDTAPDAMHWYLKPNYNIDAEMGYKYAGETGEQDGAKSKTETDAENYAKGYYVFDPYNLQIQNLAYPLRYFTANTSGSTLSGGHWLGTSGTVTLQNLGTKQTAIGYDHTTLPITNATFMVVDDGNGNMRLMPRFDQSPVVTSFTTIASQGAAAAVSDDGTGEQTLVLKTTMTEVESTDEIINMAGKYLLADGFSFNGTIGSAEAPFTGTIDGQMHTISDLNASFVGYANNAIIRNVILDNVVISSGTNVGAICNEAAGTTHIYNCGVLASGSTVDADGNITTVSSSLSGSNYVGGLVGLLADDSRVINCFSYANITGGAEVGGIVGHNDVATTSDNLHTMVMNCVFYGDITGGTSKAPIYNGEKITNRSDQSGVSNFNYFRAEASYVVNQDIQASNCALMAETRFLQRFEFFRHLLNSNRALAAWWATGDATRKGEMMKWVMEPSQIGTATPYPILKTPGKYPSVTNPDFASATETSERNKGGKLGTLTVNIQMGSGNALLTPAMPSTASITTTSLTLNITDKDPDHFNNNYYKVQLPYYNDVGTNNYTENRVVTGWKIVSITGGTTGTLTQTGSDVTIDGEGNVTAMPFNFADRYCTNKDLYSTSQRVFNQGAFWDVPEGVTAITIEPYWAKCVYLADDYYDKVYNQNMDGEAWVEAAGRRYVNNNFYYINGTLQTVYTTFSGTNGAVTKLAPTGTVYDNAIVLVGNFHSRSVSSTDANLPFTLMSADFDGDNEPDNSYILRFNGRTQLHPVRVDFLNMPGLGMAQKSDGGPGSYNFGIPVPLSWFEVTNTGLFRVTQFEFDRSNRLTQPIILQGGVIEQWVSAQNDGISNNTTYFHVGGSVWFKEFHIGIHQDKDNATKHAPVSVTGGDFDQFYLTGLYKSGANQYDDNAECYINGGRFGIMAGTGMEGIGHRTNHTNGNIFWQIDHADIDEFYGGGINAARPAEGNIRTVIRNSYVKQFCGGPKFGDMQTGKTVTTEATNCVFGNYFGAGYGGNSYSRFPPKNYTSIGLNKTEEKDWNIDWNKWLKGEISNDDKYGGYQQEYNSGRGGVSTQYDYQFLPMSDNASNVARLFVDYVSFSLATTHNVTSTLTNCTVEQNFYGGGSLGKVDGNVTSTLTDCTVRGNAFGAGYSATLPTVEVDSIGFRIEPYYYTDFGTYRTGVKGPTTTYTWEYATTVNSTATAIDKTNHILYTTEDLTTLGAVTGEVVLNIAGTTTIGTMADAQNVAENTGMAFGGGDESNVLGNTTVNMTGGVVWNRLYGGGNHGSIGTVTSTVEHSGDAAHDGCIGKPDVFAENTGKCTVNVSGGRVGPTRLQMPYDYGYVFGAGRGEITDPANDPDVDFRTYVYETDVTISDQAFITGGVYGGSENGRVRTNTYVKIQGGQIGCGRNDDAPFDEDVFLLDRPVNDAYGNPTDLECSSWEYGNPWMPYDIQATEDTPDARPMGTDGHTFFGNVFGGGSGYFPYLKKKANEEDPDEYEWLRSAGLVEGDTHVEITGGHILTCVYGGNEMTDVLGNCLVEMKGGTLGVPRTLEQIDAHPVTCYLYGAGKGDQRTHFNDWTNVGNSEVRITGGRIMGSVFGGGEDGHVLGNVTVSISGGEVTDDDLSDDNKEATYTAAIAGTKTLIGNWGTSFDDGNVFGGGRGFGGTAYTAGSVGGNVTVNISGGRMLGSVYGGGRLASVGSYFVSTDNPNYGKLQNDVADDPETEDVNESESHGYITINVSGGIIGNALEYHYFDPSITEIELGAQKATLLISHTDFDKDSHRVLRTMGGNVFTGCMGRLNLLDGTVNPLWQGLARAKQTTLNLSGGNIKSNIYGGSELGTVGIKLDGEIATAPNTTHVNMTGGIVGTVIYDTSGSEPVEMYSYGSIYGGGYGSPVATDGEGNDLTTAGQVYGNTFIQITGGEVKQHVFGGGNFAGVTGNADVVVGSKKE